MLFVEYFIMVSGLIYRQFCELDDNESETLPVVFTPENLVGAVGTSDWYWAANSNDKNDYSQGDGVSFDIDSLENVESVCLFAGTSVETSSSIVQDDHLSCVLNWELMRKTVDDSECTVDKTLSCYLDIGSVSDDGHLAIKNLTDTATYVDTCEFDGGDSSSSAGTAAVEVSEQQSAFQCLGLPSPPPQKQQRASCQRAKRPWDACAADAAVAVAPKRGKGNRGAHVRHRPDMQQAARDGAAHWQQQLRQVRGDWAAAAAKSPEFRSRYQPQLDAAAGNVKAKLECLLRTLQLAAHAPAGGARRGHPAGAGHGCGAGGGGVLRVGRVRGGGGPGAGVAGGSRAAVPGRL